MTIMDEEDAICVLDTLDNLRKIGLHSLSQREGIVSEGHIHQAGQSRDLHMTARCILHSRDRNVLKEGECREDERIHRRHGRNEGDGVR